MATPTGDHSMDCGEENRNNVTSAVNQNMRWEKHTGHGHIGQQQCSGICIPPCDICVLLSGLGWKDDCHPIERRPEGLSSLWGFGNVPNETAAKQDEAPFNYAISNSEVDVIGPMEMDLGEVLDHALIPRAEYLTSPLTIPVMEGGVGDRTSEMINVSGMSMAGRGRSDQIFAVHRDPTSRLPLSPIEAKGEKPRLECNQTHFDVGKQGSLPMDGRNVVDSALMYPRADLAVRETLTPQPNSTRFMGKNLGALAMDKGGILDFALMFPRGVPCSPEVVCAMEVELNNSPSLNAPHPAEIEHAYAMDTDGEKILTNA